MPKPKNQKTRKSKSKTKPSKPKKKLTKTKKPLKPKKTAKKHSSKPKSSIKKKPLTKKPSKSKKPIKKKTLKSKKQTKTKTSKSIKTQKKTKKQKIDKESEIFLKQYKISPISNAFKALRLIPKSSLENAVNTYKKAGLKEKDIKKNILFLLQEKNSLLPILDLAKETKPELILTLLTLSQKNKNFAFSFARTCLEKQINPYLIFNLIEKEFKHLIKEEKEYKKLAYILFSIAENSHGLDFKKISEQLIFYKPLARNKELLEAIGKTFANLPTYTSIEPEILITSLKAQKDKIRNASSLNEILFMFASIANSALEHNIPPKPLLVDAIPSFDHLAKNKAELSQIARILLELGQEAIEQGRDPTELYSHSLPNYKKKISSIEELQSLKQTLLYI